MKRKLVNSPPVDHISPSEILATSRPLIAFTGPPGTGFLIPCRHHQGWSSASAADQEYMARSVNNFGGGNGWMEPEPGDTAPKRKTLRQWIDWLSNCDVFDVFVFDSEKELFTWLAEHCH